MIQTADFTQVDRRFLWGLAYRMTGSAADADDIAQEALVRLAVKPPADTAQSVMPWLTRVTVNLSKDVLRARKRSYVGPWLPPPALDETLEALDFAPSAESQFTKREEALYAYLVALEVLTARERAVTILLDCCDYSIREVASALGITESNVKVLHHRSAKKLSTTRTSRVVRSRDEPSFAVVERFVAALTMADVALVESLLADGIVLLSDGGGEHHAARVPVVGPSKVAKVYVNVAKQNLLTLASAESHFCVLGGMAAFVLTWRRTDDPDGASPHGNAVLFDVLPDGQIARIYSVSASAKVRSFTASSNLAASA